MQLHLDHIKGWHVAELAGKLRQADKDEIRAMADLDPLEGLAESVAWSHVAYSIMEDETPIAMYGARKVGGGVGIVWMLASDALERHSIQFLRNSIKYIDALHHEVGCRVLTNFTDKRNTLHHKWLRWTGFTIGREVPFGPFNLPFYEISRVRELCAE